MLNATDILRRGRSSNSLALQSGSRFGRLRVIAYAGLRTFPCGDSKSRWACRCDCGAVVIVLGSSLTSGNTESCGCINAESRTVHGHAKHETRTRIYRIWQGMLNRCRNSNQPNYARYGGRGITVCERWHSFENFLEDMGEPGPDMTLERGDNDGPYCKDNCVWATRAQQARNKSTNRNITFRGTTRCLKEWAEEIGIDQASLRERLEKWPLDRALTEPPRQCG